MLLLPLDESWEESSVNPKNRVDSLEPVGKPIWRIDGMQADGHRLFPTSVWTLRKPPKRIDAYLSDQEDYDLLIMLQENIAISPDLASKEQSGGQPSSLTTHPQIIGALVKIRRGFYQAIQPPTIWLVHSYHELSF
jgi:hypothetical protein